MHKKQWKNIFNLTLFLKFDIKVFIGVRFDQLPPYIWSYKLWSWSKKYEVGIRSQKNQELYMLWKVLK